MRRNYFYPIKRVTVLPFFFPPRPANEMGELLEPARHGKGEVIEARHLCSKIGTSLFFPRGTNGTFCQKAIGANCAARKKGTVSKKKLYEIGAPAPEVRPPRQLELFLVVGGSSSSWLCGSIHKVYNSCP